jgi:hypothetical protein
MHMSFCEFSGHFSHDEASPGAQDGGFGLDSSSDSITFNKFIKIKLAISALKKCKHFAHQ